MAAVGFLYPLVRRLYEEESFAKAASAQSLVQLRLSPTANLAVLLAHKSAGAMEALGERGRCASKNPCATQ